MQSELGPFFHIINVHVEIVDVNDNPPTFLQDVFTVSIPENAALGVTYPLPTAFDKDTGTNNTVGDFGLAGPLVSFQFASVFSVAVSVSISASLRKGLEARESNFQRLLVFFFFIYNLLLALLTHALVLVSVLCTCSCRFLIKIFTAAR